MIIRFRYWLSEKLYELGSWIEPRYEGPDIAELMTEYLGKHGGDVLAEMVKHNPFLRR